MQLWNGHVPGGQHFEEDGNSFSLFFFFYVSNSPSPPPQSAAVSAVCTVSLFSAGAATLQAVDSHKSTMPVNQNLPACKHKAGGAVIISS